MRSIAAAGQRPTEDDLEGRDPRSLVEVLVELEDEASSPVQAELLWALPGGGSRHAGYFEIVGVPFFCEDRVRRGDIVLTTPVEHPLGAKAASAGEGGPTPQAFLVRSIAEDGGHEALPVVLSPSATQEELVCCADDLADLGARVQTGYGRLVAVDLPPEMSQDSKTALYDLLANWDSEGLLARVPAQAASEEAVENPFGDDPFNEEVPEPEPSEPETSEPEESDRHPVAGGASGGDEEDYEEEDPWEEALSEGSASDEHPR